MRVDAYLFLQDTMRIVLSDNDALTYVTRALRGRKVQDVSAGELERITNRAIEIAKGKRCQ